MHYRKLLPSDYIGHWDIGETDQTLTIERVESREIYVPEAGKDQIKAVIVFQEAKKHWVANRTNLDRIAEIHGPETDDWHGKKITLYVTKVKAFGGMVDAVRVRVPEKTIKGATK